MLEVLIPVAGIGLLLYLVSGDDKKTGGGGTPVKPNVKDVEDEVWKLPTEPYKVTDPRQLGLDEGFEVGYAHGANGVVRSTVEVPEKFPGDAIKQKAYETGYLEGYSNGVVAGTKDFAGIEGGDRPEAEGGGFGTQPGKDTGGGGPIIDTSTSRGVVMGVRRRYTHR